MNTELLGQVISEINLARNFHELHDRQPEWRRNFIQRASSFLLKNTEPINLGEIHAGEERLPTPIDHLMRNNPVWKTKTLPLGSTDNQQELEVVGTALGTKSTTPDVIKINFKGAYERTFTLFTITKEHAKDWKNQEMSEQQQKLADWILQSFEMYY